MRNEGQRNILSISPEEKKKMQEDIIYPELFTAV